MAIPLKEENRLAEGWYQGYQWLIQHNGLGYRCGYVQLYPGHPWHGKSQPELDETPVLTIHGGITFSAADETDGTWWIGFDCAHSGDAQDPQIVSQGTYQMPVFPGDTIRSLEYVRDQCIRLIDQVAFLMKAPFEKRLASAVLMNDDQEAARLLTDYMLEGMAK